MGQAVACLLSVRLAKTKAKHQAVQKVVSSDPQAQTFNFERWAKKASS